MTCSFNAIFRIILRNCKKKFLKHYYCIESNSFNQQFSKGLLSNITSDLLNSDIIKSIFYLPIHNFLVEVLPNRIYLWGLFAVLYKILINSKEQILFYLIYNVSSMKI